MKINLLVEHNTGYNLIPKRQKATSLVPCKKLGQICLEMWHHMNQEKVRETINGAGPPVLATDRIGLIRLKRERLYSHMGGFICI